MNILKTALRQTGEPETVFQCLSMSAKLLPTTSNAPPLPDLLQTIFTCDHIMTLRSFIRMTIQSDTEIEGKSSSQVHLKLLVTWGPPYSFVRDDEDPDPVWRKVT